MGALARRLGFTQVSLSSEVMPMVRAVPRGYTVCADAYLTPKIHQYLKGFTSGFKGGLKVFHTSINVFLLFVADTKHSIFFLFNCLVYQNPMCSLMNL